MQLFSGDMEFCKSIVKQYGVSLQELFSRGRRAKVVRARSMVVYGLRALGFSSPKVGRFLNRDHSSVLHLQLKAKAIIRRGMGIVIPIPVELEYKFEPVAKAILKWINTLERPTEDFEIALFDTLAAANRDQRMDLAEKFPEYVIIYEELMSAPSRKAFLDRWGKYR